MTFQSVNGGAAGKVRIDEDFHRVTATLVGSAVKRASPPAVTAVLIRRTPCEDFAGDFQGLRNQVGPNTGIVLMEVVYRVATGKAREQCADRYAGAGESDRAAVDAGRAVERLLNHGGLPDVVVLEVRHFPSLSSRDSPAASGSGTSVARIHISRIHGRLPHRSARKAIRSVGSGTAVPPQQARHVKNGNAHGGEWRLGTVRARSRPRPRAARRACAGWSRSPLRSRRAASGALPCALSVQSALRRRSRSACERPTPWPWGSP